MTKKFIKLMSIFFITILLGTTLIGIVVADENESIESEKDKLTNSNINENANVINENVKKVDLNKYIWYNKNVEIEIDVKTLQLEYTKELQEQKVIQAIEQAKENQTSNLEKAIESIDEGEELTYEDIEAVSEKLAYENNEFVTLKEQFQNNKVYINTESVEKEIEDNDEEIIKTMYIKTNDKEAILALDNIEIVNELDDGFIVKISINDIDEISEMESVIKIIDKESLKQYQEQEQALIQYEYQKRNLNKEMLEVTQDEIEEAEDYAVVQLKELNIVEENPYYYYFMDTDGMPEARSLEEAYLEAAQIIYMTDNDLWGVPEKWVSPNIVFTETSTLNTNIVNVPVSDCEEHAISFVAMARKLGIPAENVRVATGYIEMNGEKYGHAWCQIKENNVWVNVEPTSGNYVENGVLYTSTPLGLDYFEDKTYPVIEIWSYFNDEYYITNSNSNAPTDWDITQTSYATVTNINDGYLAMLMNLIEQIEMLIYNLSN
jgi:hypothetical protein